MISLVNDDKSQEKSPQRIDAPQGCRFFLTTISLHFDLWLPGESSVWNEDGTIQFESPSLFDFQKIFFRAAPSPTKNISGGRRRAAQRRYFLKMVETSQDLASFGAYFFRFTGAITPPKRLPEEVGGGKCLG